MGRALLVGLLLFLVFVLVRAPARLISLLIDDTMLVNLVEPRGTLWKGDAALLLEGINVGRLDWSMRPLALLGGRISYDLQVNGGNLALAGQLTAATDAAEADASGTVGAPFINDWLRPYDIELGGEFLLNGINVTISEQRIVETTGTLTWSGGPVTYYLSGKLFKSSLPPLLAQLGPGPSATAYAQGDSTPLLVTELQSNGYARVGVTKYLTKLLGNPWPGGDADHIVVLEVEEQVF